MSRLRVISSICNFEEKSVVHKKWPLTAASQFTVFSERLHSKDATKF